MSKYKAAVLYSSITGNTEKIAKAFAEVFQEYNIEPTLIKLEGNYLGEQLEGFSERDYDFFCIGTPVIASIPYHDLYIHFGAQDDYGRRSIGGQQGPGSHPGLPGAEGGPGTNTDTSKQNHESAGMPAPGGMPPMGGPGGPGGGPGGPPGGGGGMMMGMSAGNQHRIAFCTYGGFGEGPTEATASLELIKELFQGQNFVGFFACPGKIMYWDSSKKISEALKINQYRAQELIVRYIADPKGEYFKDYSPEIIAMFEAASKETIEDSYSEDPGFWIHDLQTRPNDRDIYQAKAFLKDVIEDYYLSESGEPRKPSSVYWSIN
ncbi:MAG: flavodoxin family protein [Ruminococcaceae bacterium]|nr:flavodoxin family protein [Oscillospiraceae bacterium]